MGFESSCFEEAAGDVVGEVSEPEGGAALVFEGCVDGLGGVACGVGVVEVGLDVCGSSFECPAQRDELGEAPRYARGGQCVDFGLHQGLTGARVGRAVGVG